jgi:hypothetical protein
MRALIFLLAVPVLVAQNVTLKHQNGTSAVYPYAQLQNAIDTAACGDIIELDPGAGRQSHGAYILRGPGIPAAFGGGGSQPYSKDCSAAGQYITIRSSKAYQLTPGARVGAADAGALAFLGLNPGYGCSVITAEPGANYWRLQGLEIAAPPQSCLYGGNDLIYLTYLLGGGTAAARPDLLPNHIIIDQCWIHGIDSYDLRDGVHMDGILITLRNSTVENVRTNSGSGSESHALSSTAGLGPTFVRNNKLSGGMIHSIWGGGAPVIQGAQSAFIEYVGNWLYRPFKWLDWSGTVNPAPLSPCPVDSDGHGATYRNTSAGTYWECQGTSPGTWTRLASQSAYLALVNARLPTPNKNMFELKNASFVHVEGNYLDQAYSWYFDGQNGSCFLLNLIDGVSTRLAHIDIENNLCQHGAFGFSQGAGDYGGWDNRGRYGHEIHIHNNLFQYIGEDITVTPGFGTMASWKGQTAMTQFADRFFSNYTWNHNTFIGSNQSIRSQQDNCGIRLDSVDDPAFPALGHRVINSIWTLNQSPLHSTEGGGSYQDAIMNAWGQRYSELAANAMIDYLSVGPTPSVTGHCDPTYGIEATGLMEPCPYSTPPNTYPPSCLGCQYPAPAAAHFSNYPLALSLQPGSPLQGAALDGRDLGADLNPVSWATAGAQSGILPHYLAMKIRTVIPASTSVQVRFSAYDTSACSLEVRIFGFPTSAPAAAVTDNSGVIDRLVTLAGLTPATTYDLKLTCAGDYYRHEKFRTTP